MVALWNTVVKNNVLLKCFFTASISLLLLLGLAACGKNTGFSESNEDIGPTLHAIGFQQWEQQLAAYESEIIVVDLWAMWCTSCIERFPHMVAMHKAYQEQNVQFVSLNLDDRDNSESVKRAEEFLIKVDAIFDNFHMNENLIDAFDKFKLIGIPAVLIYDGEGNERYRLTNDNPNNQFDEADIEEAINTLLAEA